jgi:DNA repair protein RecO (recombination protein O)
MMAAAANGEGIAVHGASLLALACECLEDEAVLGEAKRLMRALLARHLGGRPLTSRDLFRPQRMVDALE